MIEIVAVGAHLSGLPLNHELVSEGGVLRRELPHWLNAPDLRRILLAAAHPHAANTGAVHLMLRRRK